MTADWWGLTGKAVLVVGAGGIGSACVGGFKDIGARVAVIDASPTSLAAVDADTTIEADVTDESAATEAVEAASIALGGLEALPD